MGRSDADNPEVEEEEACQNGQRRLMIEPRYGWSVKEENYIQHRADNHVEPEYGVVVLVARLLLVGKSCRETTLLNASGYVAEHVENGNHPVVLLREAVEQHKTEQGVEQLNHSTRKATPDEAFRRALFEGGGLGLSPRPPL